MLTFRLEAVIQHFINVSLKFDFLLLSNAWTAVVWGKGKITLFRNKYQNNSLKNPAYKLELRWVCDSHSGGYDEYGLQGSNAV
jgi:hypothetical protein